MSKIFGQDYGIGFLDFYVYSYASNNEITNLIEGREYILFLYFF